MNEFTIKTDKNALGKRIDVFLSDDSLDIELPFEYFALIYPETY